MSQVTKRRIAVGSIIRVAEPDYCYGMGELILRVTEIGAIQWDGDERWLPVRGVQLRSNGAVVGERFALLRVAALALHRVWVPRYRTKHRERHLSIQCGL